MKIKLQKSLLTAAKIVFTLAFIWYCFKYLYNIDWSLFELLQIQNLLFLVIAVALVAANWGIEFIKWRFTVKVLGIEMPTGVGLKSMLAGISTGLVTPNRIGNFFGRIIFFKPRQRAMLVLGTLYGNLAQFIASVFMGMFGLFYVGANLVGDSISTVAIIISAIGVFLATLIYTSLPYLSTKFIKRVSTKRFNVVLRFQSYAKKIYLPLLVLSLFRYVVFVSQYLLLLLAFGADWSVHIFLGVLFVYLITTLIPGVFISKLLVRETVALSVLTLFIPNPAIIILSSVTLWIVNLGIPSLIGLFLFMKSKADEPTAVV